MNEAGATGKVEVEGGLSNITQRQAFSSPDSPQLVRDIYGTRASAIRFSFENRDGSADIQIDYMDD